jgi:hypothetical protein
VGSEIERLIGRYINWRGSGRRVDNIFLIVIEKIKYL